MTGYDDLCARLLPLSDDEVDSWLRHFRGQLDRDLVAALKTTAETSSAAGDLAAALRTLDRAERVATVLDDPLALALVWRGRANVYQWHDRIEESLAACHHAAAIYSVHGTPFDVAVARTIEVYLLGVLERFHEAIALAAELRPHFVAASFVRGQAALAANLAHVHTFAWQLPSALREYRHAWQLYRRLGLPAQAATMLHDIGLVAEQLDRLAMAGRFYARALPHFVATDNIVYRVKTLFNLAQLAQRGGQYEQALDHLAQARQQLTRLPASPDTAYVDLFEARVRRALNQPAQAEMLTQAALLVFQRLNRHLEAAEALIELAHLCAASPTAERLMQALVMLEQGEQELAQLQVPLLIAWMHLEQSELLLQLDRPFEAQIRAEAARAVFAAASLSIRTAQADAVLADCQWRRNPGLAHRYYVAALRATGEAVPVLAARSWRGLGRLAAQAGDLAAAEHAYTQAFTLFDLVRHQLAGPSHQAGFLEDKQALGEELLAALQRETGTQRQVLWWVERFKARVLADLCATQALDPADDTRLASLLRDRERLRRELDRRQLALTTGAARTGSAESLVRGPALAAHDQHQMEGLQVTQQQLQVVDEAIDRARSPLADWHRAMPANPEHIQQCLDHTTCLIAYYAAGGQLCALTVGHGPGDIEIHPLNVTLAEIDEAWSQASRQVMRPAATPAPAQARLAALYDRLIRPLLSRVSARQRLIILPIRGLYAVPFSALFDVRTQRYLVEQWTVQLAPSATVWLQCRARPAAPGPPLLVGYAGQPGDAGYLPGVAHEITALASLFPTAEILRDADASAQKVWAGMAHRAWVLLAGHTFYEGMAPLESGMPLAAESWLRASDLFGKQGYLAGTTVMLSGCEAGRGRPTGGDVLGLTSAFLYAGAASVVAGLWRVADAATATLITALGHALLAGNDTASALCLAQRSFIRGTAFHHPYYWAPFSCVGDSRVLAEAARARPAAPTHGKRQN